MVNYELIRMYYRMLSQYSRESSESEYGMSACRAIMECHPEIVWC